MKSWPAFAAIALASIALGCGAVRTPSAPVEAPRAELTPRQLEIVSELGLDADQIAQLEAKPIYQFTEAEVGAYLGFVQRDEPELPARVVRLGRKNLEQPYELFLLGEFPFETYDPQPLYCIAKSDCVVFSEHAYAMALANDWASFFAILQRIRYHNGQIGVASRNHYTEADWNVNNEWLVEDISERLAGDSVASYTQKVDRSAFLKKRYKLEREIPVEKISVSYVPHETVASIDKELRDGDFVNVIVGTSPENAWATHVGLIAIGEDGTVNLLHSTPPRVIEQPLAEYIATGVGKKEQRKLEGKAYLLGFKFLRLQADPIANLREIDGPEAPRVGAPEGERYFTQK